jgi:bacterioferritin-associated ferredoxin
MARKLVCVCNFIPEKEILQAIEKGAATLEEIKELTGAGTSCGRCHPAINNLLETELPKQNNSLQHKLF